MTLSDWGACFAIQRLGAPSIAHDLHAFDDAYRVHEPEIAPI